MKKKIRFVDKAKDIIDALEKQNIVVRAEDLVDESRPKHAPLHGYFTWDDSEAAESYRRSQAGQLIARVRVKYENRRQRAYQKVIVRVKVTDNGESEKLKEGYVSTARILSNEDLRMQVVKDGLNKLYQWKDKYSAYEELMVIISKDAMEGLKVRVDM